MKGTIFCVLSVQMQYTKGEDDIDTVAFEMKFEKKFMNDERQCKRRTIEDDGLRLVAVGHLRDSAR